MSQKISAKELIEKAAVDESELPNSVLNRQQADRFIDLVVDYSVMLNQVRTVRINHPSGEINKLDLGNIVTEGADTTSSATTRTPSESKVDYDTTKYRSAFDLATEFVEDNLEGRSIRDTLINMFTKRIAVDSEMIAIQSDSSLAVGDGESDENNLLGVNDGWQQILVDNVPSDQQVDAGGAASSRKLLYEMRRRIPTRYRVAQPNYRWIVPPSVYDKWELDEGQYESENAASVRQQGRIGRRPFGIQMVESVLTPEDLSYGTAVNDATKIWLTPLQNLIWFIQRDITIEWDRVPRQDKWEVTIHFRTDTQVENRSMPVLANNVSESGSDYS